MTNFFVGAFLYDEKNKAVLLHKRDMKAKVNPGLWAFFGGSSEAGETPEQAIIRELKEELGVDFSPEQLIPLRNYFNEKHQRESYIFVIQSELKKTEMTLGEGDDFNWIPLDKAIGYPLTENSKKSLQLLIEKYLK